MTPIIVRLRPVPVLLVLVVFLARFASFAPVVFAQSPTPLATNLITLLTYPEFYMGKQVVLRGQIEQLGKRAVVRSHDGSRLLQVLLRGTVPSGVVDLRGELWDVGRMKPDDPRATEYDLVRVATPEGREWPKPGELLLLAVSAFSDAIRPVEPTVRSVVLEPDRYEGRVLTLRGQFGSRNLFGEIPRAPGITRFDFVIRSAGAAIWVTGMRPRGKTFDFDLDSKLDTGRWLEVTGTLRRGRGLQWIEATSLRATGAVDEKAGAQDPAGPPPTPAPVPPPEVVFTMPTEGETEVPITTSVRVQVSRDLDPDSLKDHIRVSYFGDAAVPPGGVPPLPIDFVVNWERGIRAIEITFPKPLERFRTLKLELLEGIAGADKQPLKPWTLTFSLGG